MGFPHIVPSPGPARVVQKRAAVMWAEEHPGHPSPSRMCPKLSLPTILPHSPYQHLRPAGTSAPRRCRQSRPGCARERPLSAHSLGRRWQGSGQRGREHHRVPHGNQHPAQVPNPLDPAPTRSLQPPRTLAAPFSTCRGGGQPHMPSLWHLTNVLVVDRDKDIDGPLQPHERHAEQHQPLQQVVAPRPHVWHQQPQLPPEILPGGGSPAGTGQERLRESRAKGHCLSTPAQLAMTPMHSPSRKPAPSSQGPPHFILPAGMILLTAAWAALNLAPPWSPEDADPRAAVFPFWPQLLLGHDPKLRQHRDTPGCSPHPALPR